MLGIVLRLPHVLVVLAQRPDVQSVELAAQIDIAWEAVRVAPGVGRCRGDARSLLGQRLFPVGGDVVIDVVGYFAATSEEICIVGLQVEFVLLHPLSEGDVGRLT